MGIFPDPDAPPKKPHPGTGLSRIRKQYKARLGWAALFHHAWPDDPSIKSALTFWVHNYGAVAATMTPEAK